MCSENVSRRLKCVQRLFVGRAHTLLTIEHPLGGKWECGECEASIGSGFACPDCHTVLCNTCADRDTHTVPAGYRAGKICSPSPMNLPADITPTGESVAA